MKITNISLLVNPSICLTKVETDQGIIGYGQCSGMNNQVVPQIVINNIKPKIIGMSPFDLERIEQVALKSQYKFSGQLLAMAYSGVEIALWDIKGKALNQPVYNLLGGCYRKKIDLYASSMTRDLSIADECKKIEQALDRYGFKTVKIKIGPRMGTEPDQSNLNNDIEKVAAVRATIGKDRQLIVDGNSAYTYMQALQLYEKISQYDIHIFEEPCPYYDMQAYIKLAEKLPVPINVGEQDWNLFTFRDFISRGLVHYCAADVTKCGGLLNMSRIAVLCQAFGIRMSPHNTSTGIGMAAVMQFISSTPVCQADQEYSIEKNTGSAHLAAPFVVQDGCVTVSDQPGLGIELDMDYVRKNFQIIS